MKDGLVALYNYCKYWKLRLNCNKSEFVVLSMGKIRHNYNFEFGDENIDLAENYEYLGLSFNCNGRFRKGELDLKEQATKDFTQL